jgi:protease II
MAAYHGTDSADDELVYEEKDETFYVSLHKTSSRHYVIIFLASATTGSPAAGCRTAGRPAALFPAAP